MILSFCGSLRAILLSSLFSPLYAICGNVGASILCRGNLNCCLRFSLCCIYSFFTHSYLNDMTLPNFLSSRNKQLERPTAPTSSEPPQQESTAPYALSPSKATIKRAARTRLMFAFLTTFFFVVTLTFVILVEVGNISSHKPIVGSIWFLKLDLSNIIPRSVPNASLINSIARTLGLHDFYQVGLWNFCEGYESEISSCSKPKTLYWFNPVEIILNELLSGATSKPSDSQCPQP